MGQAPALHHKHLIQELETLAGGKTDRLMILMPPGSAKSTYTSILFPPWWFTLHPRSSVIAVSHSLSLAETFSRRVRGLILERAGQLGYTLRKDERNATAWRTSAGGEYIAVGVRGGITGRRADLILIDDPIKSRAEADSPTHRRQLLEWYRSDLITRLKPYGRVALVMTRWHEDDLGGHLLTAERDNWRIIRFPALAEADDPLGRPIGAPLWPDWENADALERKRNAIGERAWLSLFQQDPRPATGYVFKASAITILETAPALTQGRVVRAWDLAATSAHAGNDPDWTVGLKMARDGTDRFVILDVVRLRGSAREVEDMIAATAETDGRAVLIGLAEDPGQAGKAQIAYLAGRLAGHRIITSRETGSKLTRSLPFASQVEAGNVSVLRAAWTATLLDELRDFPAGRKDDQVDAAVRAFVTLTRAGAGPRLLAHAVLTR
jgi:predicted phage terminase large subunit-like protein